MQKTGPLSSIRCLQDDEIRVFCKWDAEHTGVLIERKEASSLQPMREYTSADGTMALSSLPVGFRPQYPFVRFYIEAGECYVIPPFHHERVSLEYPPDIQSSIPAHAPHPTSDASSSEDSTIVPQEGPSTGYNPTNESPAIHTSTFELVDITADPPASDEVEVDENSDQAQHTSIPVQGSPSFPSASYWEALYALANLPPPPNVSQASRDVPRPMNTGQFGIPDQMHRETPFVFTGGNSGQFGYEQTIAPPSHSVDEDHYGKVMQNTNDQQNAEQSQPSLPSTSNEQYLDSAEQHGGYQTQSNIPPMGVLPQQPEYETDMLLNLYNISSNVEIDVPRLYSSLQTLPTEISSSFQSASLDMSPSTQIPDPFWGYLAPLSGSEYEDGEVHEWGY